MNPESLKALALLTVLSINVGGCASSGQTPSAQPTVAIPTTASVPTLTPLPTFTALPTSTPLPTAVPTPSEADMYATVIAALRSVSKLSHRSESEVVFTDGEIVSTTAEFVPPDRKHFFSEDSEMIVVENRVYNKGKGEDRWTELQMDAAQISYPSLGEDLGDIQFLGEEALDGKPVLVYKASLVNEETGATSVFTYWIGSEDGLLHKLVSDGEVGSLDSDTGTMKMVRATTTSIFLYDSSIQIAAPIK